MPTPEDPKQAPVWENYIVAQAAQASLGLIPEHALAVGVSVDQLNVQLRFQLSEISEIDQTDIDDIVSELQILVGGDVCVDAVHQVMPNFIISPFERVRWFFLART